MHATSSGFVTSHDAVIRNILENYPDGQYFNEFLQNADDAQATEVTFSFVIYNFERIIIIYFHLLRSNSFLIREQINKDFMFITMGCLENKIGKVLKVLLIVGKAKSQQQLENLGLVLDLISI